MFITRRMDKIKEKKVLPKTAGERKRYEKATNEPAKLRIIQLSE